MNDLARQKLCEIVAQQGHDVIGDPRRTEALLQDLCSEHRREIFVLVSALRQQVAADLLKSQGNVPRKVLLAQLTKRLQENLALTEDAARWAMESWALALGVISYAEVTPGEALGTQVTPLGNPQDMDQLVGLQDITSVLSPLELAELEQAIPPHLGYSDQHVWIDADDYEATCGITAILTAPVCVVAVELPEVGDRVIAGEVVALLGALTEDLTVYIPVASPVSGDISAVNKTLVDRFLRSGKPECVHEDPYGEGWLFRVWLSDFGKLGLLELMDATEYRDYIIALLQEDSADHGTFMGSAVSAPNNGQYATGTTQLPSAVSVCVRDVLVDLFAVDPTEVTPQARFREDLLLDSLDLVELTMALEEEFEGEIDDEDAEKITTVGEAIAYIEQRIPLL